MPEPLGPEFTPQTPRSWTPHLWWIVPTVLFVFAVGVLGVNRLRTKSEDADSQFTALTGTIGSGSTNAVLATTDDPSFGPVNAKVVVVEFADFQCPFCKEVEPTVRRIMTDYSDRVRFIFRDFPVSDAHPLAQAAAEAGQCAWVQGSNIFWAFHDRAYQNQETLSQDNLVQWAVLAGAEQKKFEACLNSGQFTDEVQQDFNDGVALGVRGTPSFFFNGRLVQGVIPENLFRRVIDSLLETAQ